MERVEKMEMVEDDGRIRTGTLWTATTHAITAVIGSGVLALPWSVAQMGWIIGPLALIACAYVTYYTAILLTDCYRTPDPVHGRRNYTYMDVVRSCLGN
ncbi:Amino acid permease 4 [Ananas comosus]|uniref:Amino acid permease 4 n=1 Tax=Ananas comosus TaxID=4615 RepID=A0A199VFL9_ANACO|nr:Amino acid permease 4 [Ananas comosus]